MKKDAFYFSHDSNAKDDPKITLLIDQIGLEGFGIFWVLIETLRDQPEYKYPINLIPSLARKYATTFDKMKLVVFNYELFEIENEKFFFSKSLIERMIPLENMRIQRKNAALKSLEARGLKLKIQRPFNDRSTTVEESKVEESKVEESKVEESKVDINKFIKPEINELKQYFNELQILEIEAEKFYDFYSSKNWFVGKNKMKDWKAACRNWKRNIKEFSKTDSKIFWLNKEITKNENRLKF